MDLYTIHILHQSVMLDYHVMVGRSGDVFGLGHFCKLEMIIGKDSCENI